jgi:DNA replication protein DnaC
MSDPMMPLPVIEAEPTSVPPAVLLANHLKALKLPSFAREYEKVAFEAAQDRADYPRYLLRLCELERIDRERRMVERRIRMARFPHTKSFDTFDFAAQPSLNKALVLELARGEWIERQRNVIALGPSGTGKTHTALALGLAACQKGHSVAFTTAAALVHDLMEARDERRLRSLQKHLASVKLLILDELGYVPFTAVGGELLFEVLSQRYERGSTLITSNLPFDEWTSVFGSERLTGALLDRLTHHVHILEMNGDSFRLTSSRKRQKDKGRQNDLTKGGHRQREIGFRSATAASRCRCCPASTMGLFIQPNWPLFKPVPGPFLSRC